MRRARCRAGSVLVGEVRKSDAGAEALPQPHAAAGIEQEAGRDRIVGLGRTGLEVLLELESIAEIVGGRLERPVEADVSALAPGLRAGRARHRQNRRTSENRQSQESHDLSVPPNASRG